MAITFSLSSVNLYVAPGEDGMPVIETIEFLDDFETQTANEQPKMINLTGYWDTVQKSELVISFIIADNVTYKQELLNYAKNIIFSQQEFENKTTWVSTLSSLTDAKGKLFPNLVEANKQNSISGSDITILLTSEKHPSGRFGEARTSILDNNHIVSAEIIVFDVEKLYQAGYLAHIIEHEMGHALGLAHSNDMASVMYPRVVIVDDSIIGNIAGCEENGLSSLYMTYSVKSAFCS